MKWEQKEIEFLPIDIIDGDRGVNYPKLNEFYENEHCLFLNTGNVTQSGFDFSKCQFINFEKDEKLRKGKLIRNDIVLTTRGTLGNIGYYSDKIPFENVRINSGMVIIRSKNTADFIPNFIYYSIRESNFQTQIANARSGSAQPQLPIGTLKKLKLFNPPLPTQRKIASILSAYDDLIENNLKRIKLLEEATRNSYKQFKKETITEWIAGPFSDFFKINNGCAFKAEWYADSGVPIIRTRDYSYSKFLNVGQPIFIDDFQAENFSKFLLKEYDFMLIMVGASIGRYGIILPKDLPALQNQNQWALRENSEYYYLKVIKLLLIEEILETLLQQRTGAARDFFRASFLNELEVQVPPEKSGKELNSTLENYFNQINILQKQNTKLREARDILLPKLMNGQIEV